MNELALDAELICRMAGIYRAIDRGDRNKRFPLASQQPMERNAR